jgi:hypothetical protein
VDAMNSLEELVKEMGGNVKIPYEVTDYCSRSIVYNGGNHPEYASGFDDVELVVYNEKCKNIDVHFSDGGVQDLNENSLDDIFCVIEMVLCVKDNNFE